MTGDASLFARADEIELSWQIIDPIQAGWDQGRGRRRGRADSRRLERRNRPASGVLRPELVGTAAPNVCWAVGPHLEDRLLPQEARQVIRMANQTSSSYPTQPMLALEAATALCCDRG